jgi:hypothetical protein
MFHRNDSLACRASTEALGAVRLLRARRVALEQKLTRNASDAEKPVRDREAHFASSGPLSPIGDKNNQALVPGEPRLMPSLCRYQPI